MSNRRNVFHISGRLAALGLTLVVMTAHAQTVSGPIPGRLTLSQNPFDHTPAGYVAEEYFLSGTAKAYKTATPPPRMACGARRKRILLPTRPG